MRYEFFTGKRAKDPFTDKEQESEDFTVTLEDGKVVKTEGPEFIQKFVTELINDPNYGDGLETVARAFSKTHAHRQVEDDMQKFEEIAEVGELAKIDDDKKQVFGWAYQTHDAAGQVIVDKSGEFIDDTDELEAAAYSFVVKSRTGGVDHRKNEDMTPYKVGTMIESVVFTPEKIAKMGIPAGVVPSGWWVGFQVEDDQTWHDVKAGKKLAFSIQGKAVRKEV